VDAHPSLAHRSDPLRTRSAYDPKSTAYPSNAVPSLGDLIPEAYAKLSLKKYRPIAARNEDAKVSIGLL
jgi:hypothetical protein